VTELGDRPPEPTAVKIGVCLSGGGFRASLYALGVLRYLAEANLLDDVVGVSAVSGGSIAAAVLADRADALAASGRTSGAFLETQHQPSTPSITVYDLPPPGATRVLHYPASGAAEAPPTPAPEAPSEQAVPDSRVFEYLTPDGKSEMIGMWSPAARGDSPQGVVKALISVTADPETAERWRAELAAGRLPQTSKNEPQQPVHLSLFQQTATAARSRESPAPACVQYRRSARRPRGSRLDLGHADRLKLTGQARGGGHR